MRRMKLLLAVLAVGLLCACGVSTGTDVEKLLRAPQLSGESSAVQRALNSYLGESATLKYPTSGEFLSPFLFGDWNGDGSEDAAVLFAEENRGQNVNLAILEDRDGTWQVTQTVEGLSTEVQSVSFAAMSDSPASQIIVGYSSTQGDQYLAVYSYMGNTLETVLHQTYSRMLLADITGSGAQDLILVLPEDEAGNIELQLLTNINGSFQLSQQLPVGLGVYNGCAALHTGTGTDGKPYLVLDGYTGGSSTYLASSILIFYPELGQLAIYRPPGLGSDVDMYNLTLRYNSALLSQDIDGNGTVDIPVNTPDGGQISETLDRRLSFVCWYDFTGGNQGITTFGVLDEEYNFFLALPEELRGKVRLDTIEQGGGWIVADAEGTDIYLEVRVTDPGASLGRDQIRIATIGNQQVQVRMVDPPLGISVQTLRNGFTVL